MGRQFSKYIITGILSCLLDFSLFGGLHKWLGLPWVVANFAAMFTTLWFNFFLNRQWSFASSRPLGAQVVRYTLLVICNMLLSNLIIYTLADLCQLDRLLAKGMAILCIISWNFLLYRYVIYR